MSKELVRSHVVRNRELATWIEVFVRLNGDVTRTAEQRDKCATYCWFSGHLGEDSEFAYCPPQKRWFWGVHSCLSPLRVSPVTHRTSRIYHISCWHPSHTNLSCPSFALFTHCKRPLTDINVPQGMVSSSVRSNDTPALHYSLSIPIP